ncbi:hypothetical protein [Aestuariispira insulae]|uniref:Uncharacterized protein n=1 Tax=Aestuariispira insulae TaxID=1461337 RepID=A0A3D9HWL8_9PROT|nr:hypothetical protein [Aestuariispira insulae]RED53877.1 hypothetical protein DFP90_101676 [Aestuariispira insulae]
MVKRLINALGRKKALTLRDYRETRTSREIEDLLKRAAFDIPTDRV